MNYQVIWSTKFKKDYKLAMKRGLDINLLDTAITLLAETGTLPEEYLDQKVSKNNYFCDRGRLYGFVTNLYCYLNIGRAQIMLTNMDY